jgi:hypothetical protein
LEFDYLPHLEQEIYDIAQNPTALHHKSTPTCALALIELSREHIHKHCQFVIKPFAAKPNVLVLGEVKYCYNSLTSTRWNAKMAPFVTQDVRSV